MALAPTAAAASFRALHYRGVEFAAPSSWPVYELRPGDRRCVRFDRHAVYLGHQAADAACPAHAVGRTGSLQVEPLDGRHVQLAAGSAASRTLTATLPDLGVVVTIPYGSDRATAYRILASFRSLGAHPSSARASRPRSRAHAARVGTQQGDGFDTCTAPDAGTMATWLQSSRYRAVGVYIGGVNRACSQANLTPAWVSDVEGQGWGIIPTYVGLQAPCSGIGATIDPSAASQEGTEAADDAVAQAAGLGFGGSDPIYFDMEAFPTSDQSCVDAVKAFLAAWTNELHAKGWTSGVYGSSGSTAKVLADANGSGFVEPDDLWYANWDDRDTTTGDPFVPDGLWANHQRIHQYKGGHDETWGGATLNIDTDALDGAVAQAAAPYAYAVTGFQAYADRGLSRRVDLGAAHVGEDAWLKLAAQNTGTETWRRGGANPVRLGTWGPPDHTSVLRTSDWIARNRAAGLRESAVAPNGAGTFVAHVRVPKGTTALDEHFNLVAEGLTWMPDQNVFAHVQVVPYAWTLRGVKAYANRRRTRRARLSRLRKGRSVYVLVKAFNAGTQAWRPDGPNPVRLGTWGPKNRRSRFRARTWISSKRPAAVRRTVAPGRTGHFLFRLRPKKAGRFRERFNLVAERLTWMEDQHLVLRLRVKGRRRHRRR